MAAPTLVQSNVAATSVNSPISITPTFGVGSTAGNFLVLVVYPQGSSDSVTTPTNWTSVVVNNNNLALFVFPNNTGGITSVAVTITAVSGGAVAVLMEFSNMPTTLTTDGVYQTSLAAVTALNLPFSPGIPQVELEIFALGMGNAAIANATPVMSSEWSTPLSGRSTSGATFNPSLLVMWGVNTGPTTQAGATFGVSTAPQAVGARFVASALSSIMTTVGGGRGVLVPRFYQGQIGSG